MSDDGWVQLVPVVGKLVPDAKASVHVRNDGMAIVTLSFSEHFMKKAGGHGRCDIVGNAALLAVRVHFAKAAEFEMVIMEKGGARVRFPAFAKPLECDRDLIACRVEATATADTYIIHLPREWLAQPSALPKQQAVAAEVPPKQMKSAALTEGEANTSKDGKVDLVKYLNFRGHKCAKLAGGRFQLDNETVSLARLLESANLIRKKADLPNFLMTEIQA